MRLRRLAVIGFGRLGRACAEAIVATEDLRLAGVVRRAERLDAALPSGFGEVPVTADIGEFDAVDAALLCLPPQLVTTTAHDLLQHRMPVIECAVLEGENLHARKERLHRLAQRHHVGAVVGAGWDPGALTLLRGLFALFIPKGHTDVTNRPGVSLHHTLTARSVTGGPGRAVHRPALGRRQVAALCLRRAGAGRGQRPDCRRHPQRAAVPR